jgi:protein-S-isoprenylcysteine O-methyltransferase Ste14
MPFSLPVILVVMVRLREEEKYLLANLPRYDGYREKVPYRLIPAVW